MTTKLRIYRLAIIIAMLALLLRGSPASANNCLQDEYTAETGSTTKLNCNANDVRTAFAFNPRDLSGNPITTCQAGVPFSFVADFLVQTSSSQSRSNIGMYFATNQPSQTTALSGICSDNIISPLHAPGSSGPPAGGCTQNGGSGLCYGSTHYDEFDPSPDNCGDSSSTDPTVTTSVGTFSGAQIVTVEQDNVICATNAAGNSQCTGAGTPFACCTGNGTGSCLALPNCTSWQVPGKTILCESTPSAGWPYVTAAVPASPSKCSCATLTVGIQVQTPAVSVTKSCTVGGDTPSTDSTNCALSPEGGSVTYNVDVANSSSFGSITLDQICDSVYGNIAKASGFSSNCGTTTTATGTTCVLPQTIAAGSNYSCTFTATQAEATTVNDTVTAYGVGQDGTTPFSGGSNQVTVTSGEAPAKAQVSKTLDTTQECATVRYKVEVDNTSGSTTDETETLSALQDSYFGDITNLQGGVLGTTCGVASGQGTLSGSAGAGALPATIAVGGSYICKFDGKFCGALGTSGSCTTALSNTDSVTATLKGDETGEATGQATSASLTVAACFSAVTATPTPTPTTLP